MSQPLGPHEAQCAKCPHVFANITLFDRHIDGVGPGAVHLHPTAMGLMLDELRGAWRRPREASQTRPPSDFLTGQVLRATCPRDHVLGGHNLRPSALRHGRRECLTCDRARKAQRRTPEMP